MKLYQIQCSAFKYSTLSQSVLHYACQDAFVGRVERIVMNLRTLDRIDSHIIGVSSTAWSLSSSSSGHSEVGTHCSSDSILHSLTI
jgi:hypothetical protein